MPTNAFIGKVEQPTEAELAAVLGPVKTVWDKLIASLAGDCDLTGQEWNSYSRKAGWALRLKREKRNIVYLSPCKGCFVASFALGDQAVRAALEAGLPAAVVRGIKESRRYAEGTALRLEVKSSRDIAALKKIALIKLAN
jgi:hypothetical protein